MPGAESKGGPWAESVVGSLLRGTALHSADPFLYVKRECTVQNTLGLHNHG